MPVFHNPKQALDILELIASNENVRYIEQNEKSLFPMSI